MQETNIGWTDFSVNLLKYLNALGRVVWACVHASEGCRFCYSEALATRWGRGETFTAENMKALTPYFDVNEANHVLKSKKITGKKVFVDDMTDLFGEWVSEEIIRAHFAVFASRPDVTFQLLTKRAKRMRDVLSGWQLSGLTLREGCGAVLPNVHLGVSVEDQKNADERIPQLLETPAAVRWISAEPLLSAINARTWYCACGWIGSETLLPSPSSSLVCPKCGGSGGLLYRNWLSTDEGRRSAINGVVIGGETGAGHRQMPLEAALRFAESALAAGAAVYVKQDSGPRPGTRGRIPDYVWTMKEWPSSV